MLPRTIHRIQSLARRPIQPVTIKQLLARSTALSEEGHIQHAIWLREQVPVRLAHRLAGFLELPYVVFCNTRFHEVFQMFQASFEVVDSIKPITNMDDVHEFATVIQGAYGQHAEVISMLQEGYGELQALLDNIDLETFLDKTFTARIGNRVLAGHFLGLHEALVNGTPGESTGVVDPRCCPAEIINSLSRSLSDVFYEVYGVEPQVLVVGQVDTEISFVKEHLRFMLQEILKNALRATIETHINSPGSLPPVTVEIMRGSFDVTLKVSDRGGGMRPEKKEQAWKCAYGCTTAGDSKAERAMDGGSVLGGMSGSNFSRRSIAGYGFGLPLSRVYAQYFGGDLMMLSMHGYGSDVYLNINHLGDTLKAREKTYMSPRGYHDVPASM